MLYFFKNAFSSITFNNFNLHDKDPKYFLCIYLSKILSSSPSAMQKLAKTTSPQKLFPSDCITLYSILFYKQLKFLFILEHKIGLFSLQHFQFVFPPSLKKDEKDQNICPWYLLQVPNHHSEPRRYSTFLQLCI